MPYNDPSYRYINPGKVSPSQGDKITLRRQARAFRDVSLDFEAHPITKDLTILRNERAINQAMKNLILIVRGEVPFQHDIGSNVRDQLFEIVDMATAQLIRLEIESVIRRYEPRVTLLKEGEDFPWSVGTIRTQNQVDNELKKPEYTGQGTFNEFYGDKLDQVGVKVTAQPDQNNFEVTIAYKIVGYEEVFTVTEILTPTR